MPHRDPAIITNDKNFSLFIYLFIHSLIYWFAWQTNIQYSLYFHCLGDASASKGWTIMYLTGGMGWAIFFCRNFFSRLKAFYEFYFTSLRCISLICRYARFLFLLQTLCRNFVFVFTNRTPSPRTPTPRFRNTRF